MVKEQKLSKDLLKIESKLKEALQPVNPPALLVTDLRIQLDQEMAKKNKSKKVKNGLLLAGGIVGIAVMMITLIRSLISLPGVIKSIVEKFPRLKKREQAASI
jgi:hypothetical protein